MIRQAFPISLVFPPQGHFTQPYLALPCIKAWLVQHGFDDVQLVDASVDAYDHFLTPDYLRRARDLVDQRLPMREFEELTELPFERMEAYRAAVESRVSADALIATVEEAKRVVRGEEFYDPDRYVPATRALYHGLRLVSAAHFPSQLTPHNFTMGYGIDRSEEVLAGTLDREQNPFIAYYEEEVLPELVARAPRLVGLSVIYGSQLIPALTLGRMIKERLPHCHVTAGGGFLAYIGEKLMGAPGMDACLDSLIFWEGEGPMLALAEALRGGRGLHDVGSLTWFDRTGLEGNGDEPRAVRNLPAHPVKLDDAPVPDFDGLPLEKYFSPTLVLPYDINRGCYYGECAFCTLPTVIGPGYRTREAETIAQHAVELRDRHGATNFTFITDCMPPGMIRDLPEALIAKEANVTWWSDARVEPSAYTEDGAEKLYEAGCRKLLFGFETATPRLLKLMKKGQSARTTLQVARNCDAAGISVTFYAMVGFPSETREEARDTLRFVLENSDVVREVSLQTFHIDEVAETYRHASDFGIEILDDEGADLQLYHDYVADSGMTQAEAAEMFEEMMAGFRAELPLFGGDNIFYFMQKSHYFLHLARGTTPDEFAHITRARVAERAARSSHSQLEVPATLSTLELPFSYARVVERLAHPLARAIRPDFLTGRFSEDAAGRAARVLGSLPRGAHALAHAGGGSEFVELKPDGARLIRRWREAGTLGELETAAAPLSTDDVRSLRTFAAHLYRLGLASHANQASPQPALDA